MFGRVRASPFSPLELLEMERPSPKITKHDSLSIYEATLLKLKQGSQRSPLEDFPSTNKQSGTAMDCHETMNMQVETESTSTDFCLDSNISFQSTSSVQQCESKNMSILCFFSKCKDSRSQNSTNEEQVSGYSSSSSVTTNAVCSSQHFQ